MPSLSYGPAQGLQPHLHGCPEAMVIFLHGSSSRPEWKMPTSTCKQGLPIVPQLLLQPGFFIHAYLHRAKHGPLVMGTTAWVVKVKLTSSQEPSFLGKYSFLAFFPFFCLSRFARSLTCPQCFQGLHTVNRHTQDLSSCMLIQAVKIFQLLPNWITSHFIPPSWAALALSPFLSLSFVSCSPQKGRNICSSPVYSFNDTLLHVFLLAKPTPLHTDKKIRSSMFF